MKSDKHSPPDFERALLRSAKRDVPPNNGRAQLAAKLGLGVASTVAATALTKAAVTSVAHAAPVAKIASAKTTFAALVGKLLAAFATTGFALGVVTTSVASLALYRWHAATEHVATPIVSPSAATQPVKLVAPSPVPTTEPPVEVTAAPSPPKKVQAAPSSVASVEKKPSAGALLAEEVRLLSTARTLAREGNTLGARAALERYQSELPNGSMREEALALAIDVAAAEHRSEEVQALGSKFVTTYPSSPHIERVRAAMRGAQ